MGTELTTEHDPDHIMHSWPALLSRPIKSLEERDQIEAQHRQLSFPAEKNWILARVAALLTGYYAADIPAEIIRFEAEDWEDGLREFPQWAITKAVRWWKGESNPDRRKRPQVGDIAARARFEMGALFVAKMAIDRFDRGALPYSPAKSEDRQPLDPEVRQRRAAEIMELAGFRPKTFGDAGGSYSTQSL